jgi:hypothetical protein
MYFAMWRKAVRYPHIVWDCKEIESYFPSERLCSTTKLIRKIAETPIAK